MLEKPKIFFKDVLSDHPYKFISEDKYFYTYKFQYGAEYILEDGYNCTKIYSETYQSLYDLAVYHAGSYVVNKVLKDHQAPCTVTGCNTQIHICPDKSELTPTLADVLNRCKRK